MEFSATPFYTFVVDIPGIEFVLCVGRQIPEDVKKVSLSSSYSERYYIFMAERLSTFPIYQGGVIRAVQAGIVTPQKA